MNDDPERVALEALMFSAYPILKIESDEEVRMLSLLRRTANKLGKPLCTWSIASGLDARDAKFSEYKTAPLSLVSRDEEEAESPERALDEIKRDIRQSVVVLLDFHPYLEKARVVRLLKELAQRASDTGNKFVLLSHAISIPAEIVKLSDEYEINLPTRRDINEIVNREIALYSIKRKNKNLEIDETARSLLVNNLVGVSYSDAERLVKNAIYIDGAITHSDIPEIRKAKYRLISKAGALTFEYDTSSFDEIGGFEILKNWINKRRTAIVESNQCQSAAADRPKGLLLLGVQGCGKSLAARAIAGQLGIPLIRLDFGALFDKYIGESERNIRLALQSAEVMSPCVLWVDEIEKGISGQDDNTGASGRVLATLLNWMQENQSGTFVVATANDISALPPELIRKGRLDEIFFVDLPNSNSRIAILQSVLRKRKLPIDRFDLTVLSAQSAGFSGAEIEQAVVSALYHDHGKDHHLRTEDVLTALQATQPLSVVRYEDIEQLRQWASNRTVNVDAESDRTDDNLAAAG